MARRITAALVPVPFVILGVATLVFLGLRVIPGDAVNQLAQQGISDAQREQIREALGLDSSLPVQFLTFLTDLVQLDFGRSFYSGTEVSSQLWTALPATIELAVASIAIMLMIGVAGGVLAAVTRGTWVDKSLRAIAIALFSIPWFSLGILLILLFAVQLGWFPTFGRMPTTVNYDPTTGFVLVDAVVQGRFDMIGPWLSHLVLPAVTVGLTTAGFVLRITRSSFIDVADAEFITTARAKGMRESRVLRAHMARNAAVPIVTIVGLLAGSLLGGAIVAEVVFAYPGVGQLLVQSILQRDYPVAQGAALMIAVMYVMVNTITDIFYTFIDPRMKARGDS